MSETRERVQFLREALVSKRAMLEEIELRLSRSAPSERSATDERNKHVLEKEIEYYESEFTTLSKSSGESETGFRFVNRERELEQLSRPTAPEYLAVEAPAGYGKTALLRRLQQRKDELQASSACLYSRLPQNATVDSILTFVGSDDRILLQGRLADDDLLHKLLELGTEPGRNAVLLLIDNLEHIAANAPAQDLLWKDLILKATRRLEGMVTLRVIFSGRRVRTPWQGAQRHQLHHMELEPFHLQAVAEAIQTYAAVGQKRALEGVRLNLIVREVLYLGGGHPEAITKLVKVFAALGFALDLDADSASYAFSQPERQRLVRQYVLPCLEEVFYGVPEKISSAMQRLSILRGFNSNIIAALIEASLLEWDRSPTELLAALSRDTWLVNRPTQATPMYKDSIVRSLSASVMRNTQPEDYRKLTTFAYDLFIAWVTGESSSSALLEGYARATDHLQIVFSVEALYHLIDIARIVEMPTHQLSSRLSALTDRLTSSFISSYGAVDEMHAVFYESLQQDMELWDVLGAVGGEDVVDHFFRAVTREGA